MKKLGAVTRGRPLMSGKLVKKVKNFLLALRHKGGVVNTVVAIAAANGNNEHLKFIYL